MDGINIMPVDGESGDAQQLLMLYQRYHRVILAQLRGRVDPEDVEDVLHGILDDMLAALSRLQAMDDLRQAGYIRSIARNAAVDYLRLRMRRREKVADATDTDLAFIADPSDSVEAQVIRLDALSAMKTAICALPEAKRQLLEMKYLQELDDRQIARYMGISCANVRQRLSRVRRELRRRMEDMGYEREV